MIIVKLQGGLGNQMFQYALARSLSLSSGVPFALDAIALQKGEGITRRKYNLNVFSIDPLLLDESQSKNYRASSEYINESMISSPKEVFSLIKNGRDQYFDGYWQNEDYFKNCESTVISDFQLKDSPPSKFLEIKEMMNKTNSIAIQIRRGDYITNSKVNSIFHICDAGYFKNGIEYIKSRSTNDINIFIFSDDIKWCKENIKFPENTVYISELGLPYHQELLLISHAKHVIISNSSFGWCF